MSQADAPHGDAPHGDAPHGDAPHGDAPHGDAPHTNAPRALIVEDHPTTRETLRRLLRLCGYEADAVDSVAEAEPRLPTAQRLFLDLELVDGNGIELLRRIRAERLPVKVAITTGSADAPMLAEVMKLEPDAVFIKPIEFAKLAEWLERS